MEAAVFLTALQGPWENKKAADRKAKVLSSDLIEWSEDGAGNLTKRTKKQQIEYLKEEHIKGA